jgi:hypothetical protein
VKRWRTYLWQALIALGDAEYPSDHLYVDEARCAREFEVDLSDDASVHAAFRSIIEWAWGPASFDAAPARRPLTEPGSMR